MEWSEPLVAFARVTVIWMAAVFGATLGDTLPGESDGHHRPGPRGQQTVSPDGGRPIHPDGPARPEHRGRVGARNRQMSPVHRGQQI